jgi:predicted nucleic acid-binding protein
LIEAVVRGDGASTFESWPSPPPVSLNTAADALGVMNDAKEFALCLSTHILAGVAHVLDAKYRWERARIGSYLIQLREIAGKSGGRIQDPPTSVADSEDWEDNRILELAELVGALVIVSDDAGLQSMSPWRGIPIMAPRAFASRVDAMRRPAQKGR